MDQQDAAIIGFAYEAGYLKRTPRTGWQFAAVPNPESVAEHSFRVGVLAYVIAAQEGGNPDRAAALGLFHDLPETRIGDIPKVAKHYVKTPTPQQVVKDQVAELPDIVARHIAELIAEHEAAKTPEATLEARCSRDADKLECLLQAREYEMAGNTELEPWITGMAAAVSTDTGKRLAAAALKLSPAIWWDHFDRSYDQPEIVE